ncbi:hypothetical protein M6B38_347710 [Iris pallida]|uniref:Uncharacterized protein n=1 Tax=Iris pallida TaxID=29817 RepID=A0AAX6GSD6_IRIPA|nr:hypothetical protein M6B38_347710 [Iris pallida]
MASRFELRRIGDSAELEDLRSEGGGGWLSDGAEIEGPAHENRGGAVFVMAVLQSRKRWNRGSSLINDEVAVRDCVRRERGRSRGDPVEVNGSGRRSSRWR